MEKKLNQLFLKELRHQQRLKIARINKALDITQAITFSVCKISKQDTKPYAERFKAMRKIVKRLPR